MADQPKLTEEQICQWLINNPEASVRVMRDVRSANFVHGQISTSRRLDNSFSDLDLKGCLKSIFGTITKVVGAERCSIFLFDPLQKDLFTFVFDASGDIAESDVFSAVSEDRVSEDKSLSVTGKRRQQMMKDYGFTSTDLALMSQNSKLVAKAKTITEKKKPVGIRIPLGVGFAGNVAKSLKSIRVKDAYSDPRFSDTMDRKTGFKTKSVLCLPIFGIEAGGSGEKELLGVSTIINKHGDQEFTQADEDMFEQLLVLVGLSLKASALYEESRTDELFATTIALNNGESFKMARTQAFEAEALLKMAQQLYKDEDVKSLIKTMVNTAKEIMCADKASIFVINKETNMVNMAKLASIISF